MTNPHQSMREIYCPNCQKTATEVINAETQTRKGWYCEHCEHFEPAIGRERQVREDKA